MKEEKITGLDYKLREMANRIRELREISGFTIEEIAKLAMYLLSKEAEMVCGETVVLDGAYAIR